MRKHQHHPPTGPCHLLIIFEIHPQQDSRLNSSDSLLQRRCHRPRIRSPPPSPSFWRRRVSKPTAYRAAKGTQEKGPEGTRAGTLSQGRPASPVCFVISLSPSILLAYSFASAGLYANDQRPTTREEKGSVLRYKCSLFMILTRQRGPYRRSIGPSRLQPENNLLPIIALGAPPVRALQACTTARPSSSCTARLSLSPPCDHKACAVAQTQA